MNIFNNGYNSLQELYNSVLHGNEIELQYNKRKYYLLPIYEKDKVVSMCFGEAYQDKEIVCISESELYNVLIGDSILGDIISECEIMWSNF